MMNSGKHIIHKLNIDVDVPDLATARRIHDHSLEFFYNDVFPYLERLLEKEELGETYFRSNALEFQFSFNSEEEFMSEFSGELGESMQQKVLNSILKPESDAESNDKIEFEERTPERKRLEVWMYFLRTGQLPWYAPYDEEWLNEEKLLEAIQQAGYESKAKISEFFSSYPEVIRRFMRQFSTDFFSEIVLKIIPIQLYKIVFAEIIARGSDHVKKNELNILNQLVEKMQLVLEKQEKDENFRKSETDDLRLIKEDRKLEPRNVEEEDESSTSIFMNHSGLVLLHPYLLYFFKEFDLLHDEQFVDEDARQTAVHLLYYLATGQQQPAEYDLGMEKFLCGWPLADPIEKNVTLTPAMMEESEKMLKAVIHHWKILKNSSPDALREAFLQRNGKLIINSLQHRLIIETSTIDILLDFLPWNYSIVTLPWMKKVLHVEWQIN